jgi:hypothetical protein
MLQAQHRLGRDLVGESDIELAPEIPAAGIRNPGSNAKTIALPTARA